MRVKFMLFSLEFVQLTICLGNMFQSKSRVLFSTVNNSENAREYTFADVHDRRKSTDQNGTNADCTPKEDPLLEAEGIVDNQDETRTVVNQLHTKKEAVEEKARKSSNQQSSTQSKSKKKKDKNSSKGTTGSTETIDKCAEETTKVGNEGTSSLEGMLSVKCILDIIKLPSLCEEDSSLPKI